MLRSGRFVKKVLEATRLLSRIYSIAYTAPHSNPEGGGKASSLPTTIKQQKKKLIPDSRLSLQHRPNSNPSPKDSSPEPLIDSNDAIVSVWVCEGMVAQIGMGEHSPPLHYYPNKMIVNAGVSGSTICLVLTAHSRHLMRLPIWSLLDWG